MMRIKLGKNLVMFSIIAIFTAIIFSGCTPTDSTNTTSNEVGKTNTTDSIIETESTSETEAANEEEISEPEATIEEEAPVNTIKRVISLNPDITEIIFELGAGESLVGRSDYCTYPVESGSVESIGDIMNPNVEKIVSLEPELVICSSMMIQENIDALTQAGIKVEVFSSISIADVEKNILQLGEILNKKERAEQIVSNMQISFDAVKEASSTLEIKPTVYYVVGYGEFGDYTAGGNTFIGELIRMAGGINVAEEVTDWTYSIEKLIEDDPDIIIVSAKYGADKEIINVSGYKDLTAIKGNRLYGIDEDVVSIAGPRLAEGAELFMDIFSEAVK